MVPTYIAIHLGLFAIKISMQQRTESFMNATTERSLLMCLCALTVVTLSLFSIISPAVKLTQWCCYLRTSVSKTPCNNCVCVCEFVVKHVYIGYTQYVGEADNR